MRRVDGYLSRIAQEIDRRALVYCATDDDGAETWTLEVPGEEPLGLGSDFGSAQLAVKALIRAERARAAQ